MRSNRKASRCFPFFHPVVACAFLSLAVPTRPVPAQPYQPHFEALTVDDGLAANTVTAFLQDHHGFLWIGTEGGLNRFDGYDLTIFKHDPADGSTLSDPFVHALLESRDGTLWVGTYGGGLNRFDPATGRFQAFRHRDDEPGSLSQNNIITMVETQDGALWLGTEAGGLNRFDPATGQATHFRHSAEDPSSLTNDGIRALLPNPDGTLWVGTYNGLNRFDPKTGTAVHYRHHPEDPASLGANHVAALYRSRDGTLWVGTVNGGLNRFDPASGTFTRFTPDTGTPLAFDHHSAFAVVEDDEGLLWVATDRGLALVDRRGGGPQVLRHDPRDPTGIGSNRPRTLFVDHSGTLWVGSWDAGVSKRRHTRFSHFRAVPDDPHGLNASDVGAFAETPDGDLWIATWEGGLNRYLRKENRFKAYRHDPKDPTSLPHNVVRNVFVDHRGTLWVGTWGGGLARYEPEKDAFTRIPSTHAAFISSFHEDRRGQLWLSTFGNGPCRLTGPPDWLDCLRDHLTPPDTLSSVNTYRLYQAPDGLFWVSSWGQGIDVVDPRNHTVTSYTNDPRDPFSLSNNNVTSFFEDDDGSLWLTTYGGGLNHFNPTTGRFSRLTTRDGLPDNTVYGLLPDASGALWMSTNRGLAVLDTSRTVFTTYDIQDGLQGNEFNGQALLRLHTGEMVFGGTNGFNLFHPDSIHVHAFRPPVVLTSFQVRGQDMAPPTALPLLTGIRLGYRENFITFTFAALDFTAPRKNRYAYRLEGLDEDWVYTGSDRRYAAYPALPPGRYRLHVRSTNSDGIWNEAGLILPVTIVPPFWMTLWFRILAGLVLLGGLIGTVRYVSTRKLRRQVRRLEIQSRIQHERERISRDLHDHVGAQLSNILSAVELIRLSARSQQTDRFRHYLDALDGDARLTMSQLRETIWALHQDAVSCEAFMARIRHYVAQQGQYRACPEFHGEDKTDGTVMLSPIQALNLFRIAQEAVTNTLKHANAGHLFCTLLADPPGQVTLLLRDDGTFRPSAPSDSLSGYGLQNMERRVRELGGTFSLDVTGGTTIRITIPLAHEPPGAA